MRRTCVYTAEPAAFNLGSISHCYTLYPVYAEFVCEQAVICGWALSLCCVVQNTEQLLGSAEDQPRSGGEDPPERECLSPYCVSVCLCVCVCTWNIHPSNKLPVNEFSINKNRLVCFWTVWSRVSVSVLVVIVHVRWTGKGKYFVMQTTHTKVCVCFCVCVVEVDRKIKRSLQPLVQRW